MATSTHTAAAPTAGNSENKPITTPHSTGAWMPSTQKMNPPRAPCTMATSKVPLNMAGDDGEFGEDLALLVGGERDRILDAPGQRRPVAQKEEQEIEHDEQADDKVCRALADAERLRRDDLAALNQGSRKARLDCA